MTTKSKKPKAILKDKLSIFLVSAIVLVLVLFGVAYLGSEKSGLGNAGRKPTATTQPALNTMGFSPSGGRVSAQTNFTVTLSENSGTEAVNAVQAKILYDSTKLELVTVEEAGAFELVAATDTSTPGVVNVARATTGTPLTDTQPVIRLTFLSKSGTAGAADITLDTSGSYIVRASDSQDILAGGSSASFTIRAR